MHYKITEVRNVGSRTKLKMFVQNDTYFDMSQKTGQSCLVTINIHVNYMNAVPAGLRHHALKDGDTVTLNFQ